MSKKRRGLKPLTKCEQTQLLEVLLHLKIQRDPANQGSLVAYFDSLHEQASHCGEVKRLNSILEQERRDISRTCSAALTDNPHNALGIPPLKLAGDVCTALVKLREELHHEKHALKVACEQADSLASENVLLRAQAERLDRERRAARAIIAKLVDSLTGEDP